MDELKIHTLIQSNYRLFDASGRLPFSIDFGLCRHSPLDNDPRALVLDVSGSVLDVPYALANNLLTCHGINTLQSDKQRLEKVGLGKQVTEPRYLVLSSPVGRTRHCKDCFARFEYVVETDSNLAGLLQKNKGYSIKLATKDLGIKWWRYIDDATILLPDNLLSQPSETPKLVNSKPSAGNASFTVVDSLSWPPEISTHLNLITAPDTSSTLLQIRITNPTSQPTTIQFRGRQRYLTPRDLLGDRSTTQPRLYHTLTPDPAFPSFGLAITNTSTAEDLPTTRPRAGCLGLTSGTLDPRPRAKDLLTLGPGQRILRSIALDPILHGYEDGSYVVRLREQKYWWCVGGKEDVCEQTGDERVRKEVFSRDVPPLVIGSEDTVELRVVDGKVVRE